MPNKKVFFLLSTERSGSTFFIHLMNAHSQVFAPPTSHLIRILYNNIHKYGDLSKNSHILIQDIQQVMANMLGEWNESINDIQFVIDENIPSHNVIKSLIEQIYFPASGAKTNILIKENYSWQFFPFLKKEMKIDKFIHLVRDPRDVALSWKSSPNHPGGVKEAVARWKEDQQEFLQLSKKEPSIFRIKYEALTSQPMLVLKELFSFLEVPFEQQVVDFHLSKTAQKNASRLQNWSNIAQPILTNNHGKFKESLSKDEIAFIEFHCQDLMEELDYNLFTDLKFDEQLITTPLNKEAALSNEEKEIRNNRLTVIQQIISRQLS